MPKWKIYRLLGNQQHALLDLNYFAALPPPPFLKVGGGVPFVWVPIIPVKKYALPESEWLVKILLRILYPSFETPAGRQSIMVHYGKKLLLKLRILKQRLREGQVRYF